MPVLLTLFVRPRCYLLGAFFLVMTGCRGDKELDVPGLLQRNDWKVSMVDFDPAGNPEGSVYYPWTECEMGNKIRFGNSAVTVESGSESCEETGVGFFKPGELSYEQEGDTLWLNEIQFEIISLSPGRLKLSAAVPSATGFKSMIYLLAEY